MKLILTVDDKNGLAFNGRRQSRDSAVVRDILTVVGKEKLCLSPYSAPLFGDAENLAVSENPMAKAQDGFCFAEAQALTFDGVDVLYLYRWGRVYPSDVKMPPMPPMKKTETRTFVGSSHEKITLEVYER